MDDELEHLVAKRMVGSEPFHYSGKPLGLDILGFWQWSASNLLSNAARGVLAEYIVACALGVADGVRATWEPYDLETEEGVKVEVKSSAYIQSWYQNRYSLPRFRIGKSYGWDANTNTSTDEQRRHSDVYVFCLLHHKDQATVDPFDLDQWTFYVLPTRTLDREVGAQKSIGISGLNRLGAVKTEYKKLRQVVSELAFSTR